jgi:hypothetical protein
MIDYSNFGTEFKQRLVEAGIVDDTKMRGCSLEEIEQLRQKYFKEHPVPEVYRQFLLLVGHLSGGDFLSDWSYRYNSLDSIQQEAKSSMQINEIDVPDDAFFFIAMEGTNYWYFRASEKEDDPSVYQYIQGEEPALVTDELSDFLESLVSYSLGDWEEVEE